MATTDNPTRGTRHRRTVVLGLDASASSAQMAAVLSDCGWSVVRAPDHHAVLRTLKRPEGGLMPDAVLLELTIPETGGVALAQKIQADWPGLPVLVLSTRVPSEALSPEEREAVAAVVESPLDVGAVAAQLAGLATVRWRERLGVQRAGAMPIVIARHAPKLELKGPLEGERRRERRFALDRRIPVKVRLVGVRDVREGELRDVSSRGVCARHVGAGLALGQKVELEYKPEGAFLAKVLPATVRWVQRVGDRNDAGLEFDEPESKAARQLVFEVLVDD